MSIKASFTSRQQLFNFVYNGVFDIARLESEHFGCKSLRDDKLAFNNASRYCTLTLSRFT